MGAQNYIFLPHEIYILHLLKKYLNEKFFPF